MTVRKLIFEKSDFTYLKQADGANLLHAFIEVTLEILKFFLSGMKNGTWLDAIEWGQRIDLILIFSWKTSQLNNRPCSESRFFVGLWSCEILGEGLFWQRLFFQVHCFQNVTILLIAPLRVVLGFLRLRPRSFFHSCNIMRKEIMNTNFI